MNECCSDYEGIFLKVENVTGKCEHALEKGKKFRIKDLVPGGLCVHAYNVAFPYCLTFLKKGWFLWVRKGDGVIAQCPNPQCSLVMKIKPMNETVTITVIQIRGACQTGHKVGDMFVLDSKKMKVCPEIFPSVYPTATELCCQSSDAKDNRERCVRVKTDNGDATIIIGKELQK